MIYKKRKKKGKKNTFEKLHEQTFDLPKVKAAFLYARRRRDVLWDRPWRVGVQAGGRHPVLCPEHISKTTLARVMKFYGWIDLIQGECSVQES